MQPDFQSDSTLKQMLSVLVVKKLKKHVNNTVPGKNCHAIKLVEKRILYFGEGIFVNKDFLVGC